MALKGHLSVTQGKWVIIMSNNICGFVFEMFDVKTEDDNETGVSGHSRSVKRH